MRKSKFALPALESLELRITPAYKDYYWIGAVSDNWSAPGNWTSPNGGATIPGPTDRAIFDYSGGNRDCNLYGTDPYQVGTLEMYYDFEGILVLQRDLYADTVYMYGGIVSQSAVGHDLYINQATTNAYPAGIFGLSQIYDAAFGCKVFISGDGNHQCEVILSGRNGNPQEGAAFQQNVTVGADSSLEWYSGEITMTTGTVIYNYGDFTAKPSGTGTVIHSTLSTWNFENHGNVYASAGTFRDCIFDNKAGGQFSKIAVSPSVTGTFNIFAPAFYNQADANVDVMVGTLNIDVANVFQYGGSVEVYETTTLTVTGNYSLAGGYLSSDGEIIISLDLLVGAATVTVYAGANIDINRNFTEISSSRINIQHNSNYWGQISVSNNWTCAGTIFLTMDGQPTYDQNFQAISCANRSGTAKVFVTGWIGGFFSYQWVNNGLVFFANVD